MLKLLCITPNPAIDRTFVVPGLTLNQVHRSTSSLHTAGGKGVNVARAARILGASPTCAGFLGGEDGRRLAHQTKREGLPGAWTWIENETRTCVILVDADLGQATVINEPGPTVTDEDWERLQADVLAAAQPMDCVCISGSTPPGSPVEAYMRLLEHLRDMNKPVWVDISGATLRAALNVKGIHIKINHEEAAAILGYKILDAPSALDAADKLRRMGVSAVVLTMGASGAVLVDETGRWVATPPSLKAVSGVGSGDSFLAGLTVAFMQGFSSADALAWGVAAGTANALSAGGGQFTLEEFQRVLRGIVIS
jgi:tagatose 6-phosphate kinase